MNKKSFKKVNQWLKEHNKKNIEELTFLELKDFLASFNRESPVINSAVKDKKLRNLCAYMNENTPFIKYILDNY